MSNYPPGELQWAARCMPDAMARIEIQNVHAFQGAKRHNPYAFRDAVLLGELGMRAYQSLETPEREEEDDS